MVNPKRKALAFFLACMMLLSLLPMSAVAADADGAAAPSEGIRMDVAEGNELGTRCPDFTFTTYDGKEYNLYDTLAEKDMVLINLWATWCGPCQSEFPAMTEAYEQYKDKVEVFALSVEPTDTDDVLASYVAAMGMTFPVGMDTPDLGSHFEVMYIPTTVVVDRHGIICFVESGAQQSAMKFGALFDTFIGDDYSEPVLLEGFPSVAPTVEAEDAAKLAAALGTSKDITVANGEAGDWPFVTATADGRTFLQSSNAGVDETQAVVNASLTAKDGDVLSFDYKVSSEYGYDFLKLYLDGEAVKFFSGDTGWDTYACALEEGEHEISFVYIKDQMSGDGDDVACIDNLKVLSGAAAETALEAMPVYPHGDVNSVRLTNEKAKPILISDDYGAIASVFNYSPSASYLVGSTTATFEFTLAEGVDPDSVLIESDYSGTSTLLSECFVQESEDDPGKFLYETYVDSVTLTETPVTTVTVYYQQTGDIQCFYLFYDMDAVDALDEMLTQYFEMDVMEVSEVPGQIDISIPEGGALGQRLPNFQFTDINGKEHDLYETLAEKDMVLINIWATWCGPCEMEFPYLEESYKNHKDDIEVFALSAEPNDDVYALTEYATEHGMTFPVGSDVEDNGGADISTVLGIDAYPTSIAVDRYGRICFIEAGSQPSAAKFDQLFETFIGDDYDQSVLLEAIPGPKFEGTRDDSARISAAVNAAGSKLVVKNSEDAAEWPFAAKDGYIQSLNATPEDGTDPSWDTSNTTAAVTFTVDAKLGDVLSMDYQLQSEALYDFFVVYVDGKPVKTLSGDWGEKFHHLAIQLAEGEHEIKLTYEKDPYTSDGSDCVCIKNLEVLGGAAGYASIRRNPTYPTGKKNSAKVAGDAKAIRMNDTDGNAQAFWDSLASYAGYESLVPQAYYIANGETVTLDVTLEPGFDPETATVTNLYKGDVVLLAPNVNGDQYTVEVPLDSLGGTGNVFNYIALEATNAEGESYTYEIAVFSDETNADIFCRTNSYDPENPMDWVYAPTRTPADYGKNAPKDGTAAKNFKYTDTKGNAVELSALLKDKKAVIVLYGPLNENTLEAYTDLQTAYEKYKDTVAVVAYSTNPLDKAEQLDKIAAANKLTYPIIPGDAKTLYDLGAEAVPHTVVIDRKGVTVYSEDTAVPEVMLEALMAYLAEDDYKSAVITEMPGTACDIETPAAADQLKALNASAGVKVVQNTSKYEWPFVAATAEDGTTYLTSGNTGKHNTKAVLKTEFTAKEGDVLTFDYTVSCEDGSSGFVYDYLSVELDGVSVVTGYGKVDWTSFDTDLTAGKHTLTFTYGKDYMASGGKDMAGIRNLKVLTGAEAETFKANRPVYPFADAFSVTAAGATKLDVSDPNGELAELAGTDMDLYIANGSKVTFNITLPEGSKPEHITLVDEDSMDSYKLSELVSDDGSCYSVAVEGQNLAYGFGGIEVVDDLTGEYLAFCLVFPDEEALDDFCMMYFGGQQTFTWTKGETVDAPAVPAGEPAPEGYYVVRFVDEEGNPVEGVRVQACNGDLCTITYSDENGEFAVPVADDAHFSVASCPDGLVADTDDHLYEEGYVMIFELKNA